MNQGRIPLVIGVTGHRDLRKEDLPQLRALVDEIFADLQAAHRSSPFILLSSLAEGADRLVAQVALDQGMELVVPLPMEEQDYRADFESAESQDEFTDLLKKAETVFVTTGVPGVDPADANAAASRGWLYARAGHYIVLRCHILLALWDGDTKEKTGGTSQMVRLKKDGLPYTNRNNQAILDPPESGAIYHVVTPRKSNPNPEYAFTLRAPIHPHASRVESGTEGKAGAIFHSLLARANTFNRDVLYLRKTHESKFQKSLSYVQPGGTPGDLQAAELPSRFARLLEQFAAADALAICYQRERYRSLAALCFLILPASVFLALYHGSHGARPINSFLCLGGFCLFVAVGLIVHALAKFRACELKHLDYRALAEGLRVLFFWRLADIHDDIGGHYLRKHWSEVDWIRLAIRAGDAAPAPCSEIDPAKVKACVLTHWVEDQQKYYQAASLKFHRSAKVFANVAKTSFVLGLVLAFTIAGTFGFYSFSSYPMPAGLQKPMNTLDIVLVVLLASAGAVATYAEKLAYSQLSKQYALMLQRFEWAAKKFAEDTTAPGLAQAQAIMRPLGHEALRENGDWVLLHRERPMEMKIS